MDICAVRNLDSCPRLPPALSLWNFGHSDSSSGCYLLHSQFPHPVFDLCELWSTILPNISFLDIYDDYYDMMMMIWSHGVGIFFKKKTLLYPGPCEVEPSLWSGEAQMEQPCDANSK